ncbi:MAG TPA: hypothetical protein VMV72_01110 [Verrucomicrobiae bacterium]|nr:hypothetical protein [Verrucomicrobiae bacterium]
MNPLPTTTNADRVRRALRCFRFSKNARLVAEVIVERTVAATPERWVTTFIGQQDIMNETSLSKSRVSEAVRELELTKVIVRDHAGKGEFTVTLNPPIDPEDGRVVWSAQRASPRYVSDYRLARAIDGLPFEDISSDLTGAGEVSSARDSQNHGARPVSAKPGPHGKLSPRKEKTPPRKARETPEALDIDEIHDYARRLFPQWEEGRRKEAYLQQLARDKGMGNVFRALQRVDESYSDTASVKYPRALLATVLQDVCRGREGG